MLLTREAKRLRPGRALKAGGRPEGDPYSDLGSSENFFHKITLWAIIQNSLSHSQHQTKEVNVQTVNYATSQPSSFVDRGRRVFQRAVPSRLISDLIAERMTQVRDSRLASAEAIFAQLERELAERGARKAG